MLKFVYFLTILFSLYCGIIENDIIYHNNKADVIIILKDQIDFSKLLYKNKKVNQLEDLERGQVVLSTVNIFF